MKKLLLASATMALLCTSANSSVHTTNFNHPRVISAVQTEKFTTKRPVSTGVSAMVALEAAAQGVPVTLAMAIARYESNFTCSAVGRAGERGVMQIKPSTARGLGYTGTAKGLGDCRIGIYWGIKYLKAAVVAAAGDLKRAAFLYNAGLGAKTKNPARKKYVAAVFASKRQHSFD